MLEDEHSPSANARRRILAILAMTLKRAERLERIAVIGRELGLSYPGIAAIVGVPHNTLVDAYRRWARKWGKCHFAGNTALDSHSHAS